MSGETATMDESGQWRQALLVYGLLWCLRLTVLALPTWLVRVEALPRLMGGMLFFGYLLVFVITVVGGGLYDLSGVVALAFLPTLAISLAAMACTRRLLASRQREA